MGIFDRTASHLAGRPALLLAADPGPALLEAARLYDPGVRQWGGRLARSRLVFTNDILLLGPVAVTAELASRVGLPADAALAWYASVGASRQPGSEAAKRAEGERLVRALAARLGGSTHPPHLQPGLALLASVYSEQAASPEQVIEVLRPYAGKLALDDVTAGTYSLTGKGMPFYTAYFPPEMGTALGIPPALGKRDRQRLHHWDLHTGKRADKAPRELCLTVAGAALALAASCGGTALDMFGFPLSEPGDLVPG